MNTEDCIISVPLEWQYHTHTCQSSTMIGRWACVACVINWRRWQFWSLFALMEVTLPLLFFVTLNSTSSFCHFISFMDTYCINLPFIDLLDKSQIMWRIKFPDGNISLMWMKGKMNKFKAHLLRRSWVSITRVFQTIFISEMFLFVVLFKHNRLY